MSQSAKHSMPMIYLYFILTISRSQ